MTKKQLAKFKRYDVVTVQWIDSVSDDRWVTDDVLRVELTNHKCVTTAQYIGEDQGMVALATTVAESGLWCMTIYIPLVAINKIIMVKEFTDGT